MSLWDQFVEEFETIGRSVAEWLPKIVVALIVLIIGRWLLGIIRKIVERLLSTEPVQRVFERAGITAALAPSEQSAAQLAGMIIYVILMVGLWLIVFRILELPDIVDLLERLLAWIPVVLLAAVVVIISAAVANWTADLVRPFAAQRGIGWLATVVYVAVLVFGVLFALDILEVSFAEDMVKIVLAATGVTLAIAFGVGGIDTAKKWWERYATPPARSGGTPGSDHLD